MSSVSAISNAVYNAGGPPPSLRTESARQAAITSAYGPTGTGLSLTPAPPNREADAAEISDLARTLSSLRALPDVRTELVNRVKAEIESGAYDSPEALEAKIDGSIDEILNETDAGL